MVKDHRFPDFFFGPLSLGYVFFPVSSQKCSINLCQDEDHSQSVISTSNIVIIVIIIIMMIIIMMIIIMVGGGLLNCWRREATLVCASPVMFKPDEIH